MLQQTLNNLQHDLSLVQLYVRNNQDAGFSDMTRLLESLSIKLFAASHGLKLHNKNFLHPNFPAIDLADEKNRTAVQVTTNADGKKIRHTLKMFAKHDLADDYDKLFIFGFLDRSKLKDLPSFCTVLQVGDLISALADLNDENLAQDVVDAVKQHSDFARIHPYDDRNCLEIVLRCIDRNAIKHRMICEGSYSSMVDGLNEITELISKGSIHRRSKGKSIDEFRDARIRTFLTDVRDIIGRIVAIVNQNRDNNSDFVMIDNVRFQEVDELKREIIEKSNAIAQAQSIDVNLRVI